MKHMACGTVAFLGVVALAGCYSYASEAINNGNFNKVQATPDFAVIRLGDSDQVIMRLVNDFNNGAVTSYTVSNVQPGIAVHNNANYRPVYDAKLDTLVQTGDKNAQQYFVVGLAVGVYTFTMTPTSVNTGISTTVTVVVTPRDLGPALSKATAVAGDTVIVTAPTGTVFSSKATISFATGGKDSIVSRAPDSTSFAVVVNGGITGPATVTGVGVIASPGTQASTVVTTNTLTTPPLFSGVNSKTTANAGDIVTITAPANQYFSDTSKISFAKGPAARIISRAPDSSAITYEIGPDSGQAVVTVVGIRNAKGVLPVQTLNSSNTISAPLVLVSPAIINGNPAIATIAPNIGVPVTVTLTANLRFIATSQVAIGGAGGRQAGIISVSPDSLTAVIMPMTGSFGVLQFTNVVVNTAPEVPFAVPGDKTINVTTVYAGPSDPNATSFTGASTIVLPPSGRSFIYTDQGPFATTPECTGLTTGGPGCRFYKITTTATKSYDSELRWDINTNTDMGLYVLKTTGALQSTFADQLGSQSGGPEVNLTTSGNVPSLPAGNFVVAVVIFGNPAPQFYQFRISTR